jgi:hypothetical protein
MSSPIVFTVIQPNLPIQFITGQGPYHHVTATMRLTQVRLHPLNGALITSGKSQIVFFRRLHVAMNNASRVRSSDRIRHLARVYQQDLCNGSCTTRLGLRQPISKLL